MEQTQFPCPACGANVQFDPATQQLHCSYCGHTAAIEDVQKHTEELDYLKSLESLEAQATIEESVVVHCNACGAETTLPPNITGSRCPFCDSPIVSRTKRVSHLQPQSLLPFRITHKQAMDAYTRWLHGLWFAPSRLKKMARIEERLRGLYLPYWTYDSHTRTAYTGMRGDDYFITESYTTIVNGKPVVRTRQVRKTRWRPVSGNVRVNFDDILILASHSLPRSLADELEPWDLRELVAYKPEFLAGFTTQSYEVDLKNGFGIARNRMTPIIDNAIRQDIGGDHQRILTANTRYYNITFKHILLPVWLASYMYHNKVYRFMINARTGEVQGLRPWSAWKISLAVLAGLIVVLIVLGIMFSQ